MTRSDAARLGLAPVPAQALAREALELARGQARAVLKIVLMRAGATRGYGGGDEATDRLLCRYPLPGYRRGAWDTGVRAFRSAFRLATQPALAGIKHLNRLEQVLASRDWPEGAEEALLGDDAGRPIGGTRTNLFWVGRGVLRTPSLERCGVAGLMRGKVLALAGALGIPLRVGEGSWEELESAEEAFLTNSLVGIWPLARLDSRQWPAPGPVTRQLDAGLNHPRAVEP